MHPGFPCERTIDLLKETKIKNISVLWGTFGHDKTCLDRILSETEVSSVLIHPTNETCRRRECFAGEVFKNYGPSDYEDLIKSDWKTVRKKLRKRLTRIKAYIKKNPDVKFFLSTGLEDNFTLETYGIIDSYYRRIMKGYVRKVIRNPIGIQPYRRFGLFHGPENLCRGADCWYSNDGIGIRGIDRNYPGSIINRPELQRQLQKSRSYLWWGKIQGLAGDWIRPCNRNFRFSRTDSRLIKEILNGK